jgi:uncharacterized Zn finger protein
MRLDNFKRSISPNILERGRNYFRSGRVSNLSFDDEESWSAQVGGTETYDIQIEQDPRGELVCTCLSRSGQKMVLSTF